MRIVGEPLFAAPGADALGEVPLDALPQTRVHPRRAALVERKRALQELS